MYQTSRSLFSDSYTIIFPFCINTFFIHALHLSIITLLHLSIIYAPQSYTALDTLHLYVTLIFYSYIALISIHAPQSYTVLNTSHLHVTLIFHSCIALISIHVLQSCTALDTLHLCDTLISHSCIAFFHYLCIIYTASWSIACFFSSSYIKSSFWLLDEEM